MQDAGGHFGHARPPGSQHEALLRLGQLGVGPFLGGDLILKFPRSLGDAGFELVVDRSQFRLRLIQQRVFVRDQDAPEQRDQEHGENPGQHPQQPRQRPPGRRLQQLHIVPGTEAEQE